MNNQKKKKLDAFLQKTARSVVFTLTISGLLGQRELLAQTYVETNIVIREGGNSNSQIRVAIFLSKAIQMINKTKARKVNHLEEIKDLCTSEGHAAISKLVADDSIYTTFPEMTAKIVSYPDRSNFEVRDIRVNLRKKRGGKNDLRFKYVVFKFNQDEKIADVEYEKNEHNALMDLGLKVEGEEEREAILKFIERYQEAYNQRDSLYLDKTLSEDALIIVGLDLRSLKEKKYSLEDSSNPNRQYYKLIVSNKDTYLINLKRKVFRKAKEINVTLRIDEIVRHEKRRNLYGVNLFQKWHSDFYNDKGYLFLMFDFENKELPIIHVRSFQFHPFRGGKLDGDVIRLSSFYIP